MSHKIVGVSHSNNSTIKVYIKNQLDAIKDYKSALAVAEADETYSLIESNIAPELRNRFPMLMYIKNDKFVTCLHGKFENTAVFKWINSLGV
tara:strand:+ start:137 stop:412 length:276 start_codon:yes stop_codon:yes gene_type:complete